MNFLVDAQLPRDWAIRLTELGHIAAHTLDLPDGNRTPDNAIAQIADGMSAVVVTKDADFLNSHLLKGVLARLLLVSTGNISNHALVSLFNAYHAKITAALNQAVLVELSREGLVIHG